MGRLVKNWHNNFLAALTAVGLDFELGIDSNPLSLSLNTVTLIKLRDLDSKESAESSVIYQNNQAIHGIQVIHIWEDIWLTRREQVLSRLKSINGLNNRIHARKTKIIHLSQAAVDLFMNQNHIQYSARVKFRFGLKLNETLVAVACFSRFRKMNKGIENYRSAELVRFANLQGMTVVGGMTKLLAYFIKQHQPSDIMSYADRDWSKGSAYEKSGFNLINETPSSRILVNKSSLLRTFPHRMKGDHIEDSYYEVFNLGNLKYILTCE